MEPQLSRRLLVDHGGVHVVLAREVARNDAHPVHRGELPVRAAEDGRRSFWCPSPQVDAPDRGQVDVAVEDDAVGLSHDERQPPDASLQRRAVAGRESEAGIVVGGEDPDRGGVGARNVRRERRVSPPRPRDGGHRHTADEPDEHHDAEVAARAPTTPGAESVPREAEHLGHGWLPPMRSGWLAAPSVSGPRCHVPSVVTPVSVVVVPPAVHRAVGHLSQLLAVLLCSLPPGCSSPSPSA